MEDETVSLEIHDEQVMHVAEVFLKYLFIEEVSPGEVIEICGKLLKYVLNNSTLGNETIKRLINLYLMNEGISYD